MLVPSRGRPEAARTLAAAFRGTTTAATELVFVVDEDDPRVAEYSALVDEGVASVIRGQHVSMVDALNQWAYATATMDDPPFAIGFMGDDHLPRTHGWDAAYLAALRDMGTGLVYGNDLLRGRELPTQVAMTSDIVRALGYMAPTTLKHLYVDNFWLDLGRAAACIRYLPEVVVEHRHPTAGKAPWDEGYRRVNDQAVYSADAAAYDAYVRDQFRMDADKVRLLVPPVEWRLFAGDVPFVSTFEFHEHRDRAPHLEQADHRSRILAAADLVREAAASLASPTVSDLGCGDGGLLSLLGDVKAWGYDFAPANAAGWAERGVTAEALDAFGADRDRVRFGDIAVATEVLEHVADPHGALRWIRDHSRFVVASSPRFETGSRHVPEHAWAWNEPAFAAMFRGAGWTILRHEMDGPTQLILAER